MTLRMTWTGAHDPRNDLGIRPRGVLGGDCPSAGIPRQYIFEVLFK